jgi:hypothetical protein
MINLKTIQYSVCLFLTIFALWELPHFAMQSTNSHLTPFYVITFGADGDTNVWQVDPITEQVENVFRLPDLHEGTTGELLSENELNLLHRFPPSLTEDVTKLRIGPSIEHVVPIDSSDLLIITKNYFCYSANGKRCFGYYELLRVNLVSNSTVSIWKVDLNERFINLWGDCTLGRIFHIRNALLNPTHNLIALTIEPEYGCSATFYEPVATLILNYETSSILAEIPYTDNSVWSADGQNYTFSAVSRDCASGSVCQAAISNYFVPDGTTSEITRFRIPRGLYVTFNWLTPNSILYQNTSDGYIIDHEKFFRF